MIKYVKKTTPEFEALQFEGGRENATTVGSWLADHEVHTAWYDKKELVEPIIVPPAKDAAEGTPPIEITTEPERLVLEFDDGSVDVRVGNWIVIDEDHRVSLFTAKTFPIFFEQKK